jgi:hypothetical protein
MSKHSLLVFMMAAALAACLPAGDVLGNSLLLRQDQRWSKGVEP